MFPGRRVASSASLWSRARLTGLIPMDSSEDDSSAMASDSCRSLQARNLRPAEYRSQAMFSGSNR